MKVDIGGGWGGGGGGGDRGELCLSRIFFHNLELRYPFLKVVYSRTSKAQTSLGPMKVSQE